MLKEIPFRNILREHKILIALGLLAAVVGVLQLTVGIPKIYRGIFSTKGGLTPEDGSGNPNKDLYENKSDSHGKWGKQPVEDKSREKKYEADIQYIKDADKHKLYSKLAELIRNTKNFDSYFFTSRFAIGLKNVIV